VLCPYIFYLQETRIANRLHKKTDYSLSEHLSSPPVFSRVRVTRSLVLCVCFVDRSLSFFFWPLCCLSFFDLRILIDYPFGIFKILFTSEILIRNILSDQKYQ
jgi:hypothetical protein